MAGHADDARAQDEDRSPAGQQKRQTVHLVWKQTRREGCRFRKFVCVGFTAHAVRSAATVVEVVFPTAKPAVDATKGFRQFVYNLFAEFAVTRRSFCVYPAIAAG